MRTRERTRTVVGIDRLGIAFPISFAELLEDPIHLLSFGLEEKFRAHIPILVSHGVNLGKEDDVPEGNVQPQSPKIKELHVVTQ